MLGFQKTSVRWKWSFLIPVPMLLLLHSLVWFVLRSHSQLVAEPEELGSHNSSSSTFYTTLVPVKQFLAVTHSPAERHCQCEWKVIKPRRSEYFKVPKKYLCLGQSPQPVLTSSFHVGEPDRLVMPPAQMGTFMVGQRECYQVYLYFPIGGAIFQWHEYKCKSKMVYLPCLIHVEFK